ncbi:phosphodiester glycosidase family protein [Paenibacillus sp. N3.4]|uniref:phosphodiester glycosidase family protein n=1 Tax=Paenibacillus sp. N3.4 TaxID=2603222 RepID=UPI0011CC368E|nr:phosphodiester glycosidase family protein [Paenibacillus sp. N3.4]TXK81033.1 hypothetical protein FU659_17280 [Paenibacillus sp. N3.4]
MSNARYNTFVTNGVTCHVIVADYDAVTVETFGSSSSGTLQGQNRYGINGTFYGKNPDTVWQIAAKDGAKVITGGDVNCYPRQTMYCYTYGGSTYVAVSHVSTLSQLTSGSNPIKWAIGGVGYYLDKYYDPNTGEQAFINEVSALENTNGNYNDPVYNFSVPGAKMYHTAIGYRSSDKKVIMLACNDSSAWQVRKIMKEYIGCTDAIYLDSNPSTMLRARNAAGAPKEFAAVTSNVLNYVTVKTDATWTDV